MSARIRRSVDALQAYVPGEQPTDPGIVKLNTNENPYPPSPRVSAVLSALDPDALRRYPDPVCVALRARLAEIYDVTPANVFVGNGSDEVLALCTRAFVENDGAIGYFDTTYSLYPVLADIRDVRRRPVPLAADFAWRLPEDGAFSVFFVANPNAPIGTLFTPGEVRELCARVEGVVVVDEAYAEFASGNCLALARELDNALVVRTLSKSFSLAGLRLGYAVGPEPLIAALFKIKDSYNVDAVAQRVALTALEDLEWMRRNAGRICRTRERTQVRLENLGFRVWPSEANFLWVRPSGRSAKEVFDALRDRGIVVRYFPGPKTGDGLRITIADDESMDALVEALGEIVGV